MMHIFVKLEADHLIRQLHAPLWVYGLLLWPYPASYAQVEPELTDTLPKVVVTAQKIRSQEQHYQRHMFEQPYSAQIVSKARIDQENLPDVKEAIRQVAGVNVTESGAFYKKVSIRGLSGQRVVTLVDGIKIANQGLNHTGAGETNSTDIYNVDRIEVVKGSPAVLYDAGASGGVINISTSRAPIKDGVQVSQKHAIDQGYDKYSTSTNLQGGYAGIGAKLIYSKQQAEDYKVRGGNTALAISNSNLLNGVSGQNTIRISDLGYQSESLSGQINTLIGEDLLLSMGFSQWEGRDLAFAHGQTLQDSLVSLTDRLQRDTWSMSLQDAQMGELQDVHVRLAQQTQRSRTTPQAMDQTLDSDSVQATAKWRYGSADSLLQFGAELSQDQAVTAVYSEQDYASLYAHVQQDLRHWNLFAGLRLNHWQTRQKLLAGANQQVAADLIGISGLTPENTVSAPTWSLGAQYKLSPQQHVSLNLSKTYRHPDLMERYAFGSSIGGGLALEAEQGQHAELMWKYMDQTWGLQASAFYSDFDQYIWTKTVRQLTNRQGLEQCIALKLCDPATGNYNNQESDFFNQYIKYYNADQVSNAGIELNAQYFQKRYEFSGSLSFNQIDSQDLFVKTAAYPLDLKLNYKYQFQADYQPWVKLSLQQVWNTPEVEQMGGFAGYGVAHLYAGLQTRWMNLSAGIRNLGNTTYRAPYSGLNGLERSFFASIDVKWGSQ